MVMPRSGWLLAPSTNKQGTKKGALRLLFYGVSAQRSEMHCYRSMPLWRRSELTLNFLRPFARRELKTLRPLAEDMRLRKPCLFRRLRTEG